MHVLSTLGGLREIKAAAEAFDRLDPNPASAVSWYEETPTRFRLFVYAETEQDAASARAVIGHVAPELPVAEEEAPEDDWVAYALDGLPAVKAGRFIVAGAHALSAARGETADPGREAAQIERLRGLARSANLDPDFSEKFLRFIIDEVIRHHEQVRGAG